MRVRFPSLALTPGIAGGASGILLFSYDGRASEIGGFLAYQQAGILFSCSL